MIIKPPSDEFEIIIPFMDEITEFTKEQYDYIKERLKTANEMKWKCPNCGTINSGLNEVCVWNRHGNYCRTKRSE